MMKNLVRNAILFDAIFNLLLGVILILFYRHLESLISESQIMAKGLWQTIGIVVLSYGIWQTIIIYRNKINKSVELISGVIAWLFFFILSYALLFLELDIYPAAYVILWFANIYIFSGGIFFFWAYKKW